MDILSAYILLSVIGLIIIIVSIVIIIPAIKKELNATAVDVIEEDIICPENATTLKTKYKINDNCYCKDNSVLISKKCILCPTGAISSETLHPIIGHTGCYCPSGTRWSGTGCIANPYGSSTLNTGIRTNIDNIYCLTNRYWNSTTKSCDACPFESVTDPTNNVAIPGYTGCYCTPEKAWNESMKMCGTEICDGHGSIQNGKCICDPNYYLFNGTYCTLCIDGAKSSTGVCTCPFGTTFSSQHNGCIA